MALLCASTSPTISIPHPLLSPLKPPATFLCHSSSSKTSAATASSPTADQTPSSSSLSDQLLPLSLTLLTSQPTSPSATVAPPPRLPAKPTWTNPSKPRPTVLALRRQSRRPFSHNPSLRPLTELSRTLRLSPDLPSALAAAFPPGHSPSRDDALLLLNSLRSWQKSLQFLDFLRSLPDFPLDTIFYNVVLKSLRAGHQWHHVERLAGEMIDASVPLDNITYSTIITAAKRCRRFDGALHWFERMYRTGLMPDEVTYSAVLDVYARLGRREEVVTLYERACAGGWRPDAVAFSVLGKMFGEAGDYDGIRYVLKEMKELGVKPNAVVYNTLIQATGKAGKPGLARSLFEEMVAAGVSPNEKTLTSLIKIYGKARWSRDALELWERMKSKGWPVDFILYNTLLSMCADLGLEDEAEKLFEDMRRPDRYARPDSWSYTAMINIYGSGGKPDRAVKMFEEMLEKGVEPNVMSCTCLIRCLGKAGRIGDAVRVFETAMERGIRPDDRLCGCLLSVAALCEEGGETDMVLGCLEKANSRLVGLLKMLRDEQVGFGEIKDEFRGIMNEAAVEVRRPFCNCLIDVCRNQGHPSRRANELLRLGNLYGLYPGLHARTPEEWSLNLRSLSVGAAKTAFEEWLKGLWGSVVEQEEEALPLSFSVCTGSGTHKFSQGLATSFTSHLSKLAAPFRQVEEKSGSFVASKEDLVLWLKSTFSPAVVNA
ncbi:PPR repeat [Musa troglodytarum]|uniref:PPR repeat n=1 Tax=Musa troglodytarum TaxID=320322 RepID=A0A9E7JH80_9LILI|nr:PPR repeat [Musa troglodytarum]